MHARRHDQRDGDSRAASSTPIPTQLATLGDRLGNVLTGPDGSFQLDYDDADYRVRNPDEQRPDLMLLVTTPEDAGAEATPDPVLAATPIRQGAGRIEQYLVRLTGEQLTAAGIPLPTTSTEA